MRHAIPHSIQGHWTRSSLPIRLNRSSENNKLELRMQLQRTKTSSNGNLQKGHEFAAKAESHMIAGNWIEAMECHRLAADCYKMALIEANGSSGSSTRSNNPKSSTKMLQVLVDSHEQMFSDLKRRLLFLTSDSNETENKHEFASGEKIMSITGMLSSAMFRIDSDIDVTGNLDRPFHRDETYQTQFAHSNHQSSSFARNKPSDAPMNSSISQESSENALNFWKSADPSCWDIYAIHTNRSLTSVADLHSIKSSPKDFYLDPSFIRASLSKQQQQSSTFPADTHPPASQADFRLLQQSYFIVPSLNHNDSKASRIPENEQISTSHSVLKTREELELENRQLKHALDLISRQNSSEFG